MTDTEKREAARQFYQRWANKGREDEDARSYWIEFLQNILGVENVTERIDFEKKVIGPDGNTKKIDVYIPETKVLIEQKSLGIDLAKPQHGHDGMTPYEQAKMYDNSLPHSEKSRWIIISNFAEIWVYDLEERKPEPKKFTLAEIPVKYGLFNFLVNEKQQKISEEMEISVKAGEFVGLIYDALLKQYINPDNESSLKSLNMLCVRLVFCLYAEDAHIFGSSGSMFHDYMEQFDTKDMRRALIDLFRILDTPEDKRDPYDTSDLSRFPYVNGGLFAEEDIEIPNFTDEIRDILLSKASEGFDWSMISPTIFGAVFESTLNPETRRSGGMHYTSIENIHKVIDPLFLDELKNELSEIEAIHVVTRKETELKAYQGKLASLRWLDPACGSGNFLTETYISVRRLENQAIRDILDLRKKQTEGQIVLGLDGINPIQVSISQFYGIEINDFAVTVAKAALWIAESQMMKETEDIVSMQLDFLPLKTNANIIEGNALRLDWNDVVPADKLNYIMGNPPFRGYKFQSSSQKQDIEQIAKELPNYGTLDYVSGWYLKAADYIKNTSILCAFVSTNSVCQGEHVTTLWKPMFEAGISIILAYQTFMWNSEANEKAAVHCVIVGFSNKQISQKYIFSSNGEKRSVKEINGYLLDAPITFISKSANPLSKDAPIATKGNAAMDDGNLLMTAEEKQEILEKEPYLADVIRRHMDASDFLNNGENYCFWFDGVDVSKYQGSKELHKRFAAVRDFRNGSDRAATRKMAQYPMLFAEIRQPKTNYIMIPVVSSERRRYVPMAFLTPDVINSYASISVPDATLYHFGILSSNVHNSWIRAVAGRLKSDYRYATTLVYNTFVWPNASDKQRKEIESTAQGIIDARKIYEDSSLSKLYDPLFMPPELQKAHTANDRAVMQAYGFSVKDTSEADCVAALMKMYQELTKE